MASSKSRALICAVAAATASVLTGQSARATDAFWTTGTGLWSTENVTSLGWAGALPDAIGDSGTYDTTGKGSATTTQDFAGARTVGRLEVTGTGNSSWSVALNSTKDLTLNQDGAGPGTAVLSNTINAATNTNPALILTGGAGIITLNDDLLTTNTSTSTRANGAIQIDPQFQGAGNITFYNVSNNTGAGQIALFRTAAGGSNFSGNTTIAKGAVTFSRGDRFSPSPANVITIGRNDGSATLAFAAVAVANMENNFVAAANPGGTLVLGTTAAATGLVNIKSTNSFAANFTLNGDLSFSTGGTGTLQIGDPIVGVGKVTKIGPGPMRVTNANSYSGGTVVNAGSLAVGHTDAITTQFGSYVPTDGTLGSGDVTVNNTATQLEIESLVASVNVIADSAALYLGAGGTSGRALLNAGVNETVGGLVLGGVTQTTPGTYGSTSSGATFQNDAAFSGPGTVTLALGRVLFWDTDRSTAGAGGATPTGNWNGTAINFNTDSTGGGGGTQTANSLSTDPVVFTAGTDGTGTYTVNVSGTQAAASVSIARGNVTLAGGTLDTGTFDVASGATGTVTSTITGGPGSSVIKNGAGTLSVTNVRVNTFTVNAGQLRTLPIPDPTSSASVIPAVSNVNSIVINGTAQLNLTNNRIITKDAIGTRTLNDPNDPNAGGVYSGVQGLVQKGYNEGTWDGNGIITSESAALDGLTTIGVARAGDVKFIGATETMLWSGQTINGNDTLVMYTYGGDADLNGKLDADDYSFIDVGIGTAGASGYANGDFNYDGVINADDYSVIDTNINSTAYKTAGPFWTADEERGFAAASSGLTAVPEPTGLGVLALAATGLLARRRRVN
ncbi:hypothetical protein BH24ACT15_BH24ACT15_31710 [soil metagenome]